MPHDENALRSGTTIIQALPEVMPEDANDRIQSIYEDIKVTLRVPFVNQIFRLLANEPAYLEEAWRYLREIAATRSFEEAARELRAEAFIEPAPQALDGQWAALGDIDRVRRFTQTVHYVLPKLLLLASLLDLQPRPAGREKRAYAAIPEGVAAGTERIEMIDPSQASEEVRLLFQDIRERHGHPSLATYYRSLAQWPDLLQAVWKQIRPLVGDAAYDDRVSALVEAAAALAAELAPEARQSDAPGEAPGAAAPVLGLFRQRVIPDLLIDVTRVKTMICRHEPASTNRFDTV